MIGGAVDDQRNAISLPDDAALIWEEAICEFRRQKRGAAYAPFRGFIGRTKDFPRLMPWASFLCRYAAGVRCLIVRCVTVRCVIHGLLFAPNCSLVLPCCSTVSFAGFCQTAIGLLTLK